MTVPSPPADWRETTEAVLGADQTYVYPVGDDARVLVGLSTPPDDAADTRLEVSTIEETGHVTRHDFVAATLADAEAGVEAMRSFMRFVAEEIPAAGTQDVRLFRAVQRCIEEFDPAVEDDRGSP